LSRDDEGKDDEGKDDEGRDDEGQDDEGRVGIFPSWSWMYGAVIVYGVLTIGVLTLLTRILDFGAGP
jgi:hypothetical protein